MARGEHVKLSRDPRLWLNIMVDDKTQKQPIFPHFETQYCAPWHSSPLSREQRSIDNGARFLLHHTVL